MPRNITSAVRVPAGRRRRTPRPLDLFSVPSDRRTAAAMDDATEARQLVDDLLALIDAGLIVPLDEQGEVRYAPAEAFGDPAV